MKIKLKSKLWVWLYCEQCKETCYKCWAYRKYDNQTYLLPPVFRVAGKVVNATLVDKDALNIQSNAAYKINVNGYEYWVPNWFISEVYDD